MKAKLVKSGGNYRIFAQRGKYKWWFELGKHKETDARFEEALMQGDIEWKIHDPARIFQKM